MSDGSSMESFLSSRGHLYTSCSSLQAQQMKLEVGTPVCKGMCPTDTDGCPWEKKSVWADHTFCGVE